jgi:hypothetical protein
VLLWVLLGSFPILSGLGYGGGAMLAMAANSRDAAAHAAQSTAHTDITPSRSPSPAASPSGSPVPAPTWLTSRAEPKLRTTNAKPVLGPAFEARDPTYTVAFPGWPFAFRVPPTWGCANGRTLEAARDAYRKVCIDEGDPSNKQAVVVSLQRCFTGCTTAHMRDTALAWLASGWPVLADSKTWYVETPKDADGYYVLDLARVFSIGGRHYVVAVYARAFSDDRDIVLKVVNDIAAQTAG